MEQLLLDQRVHACSLDQEALVRAVNHNYLPSSTDMNESMSMNDCSYCRNNDHDVFYLYTIYSILFLHHSMGCPQ